MTKLLIPSLLLSCFTANAQLPEKRSIHPGVTSITTTYFNSLGKKQNWSYEKVNAEGRITERMQYRRKTLIHHEKYSYNQQGDQTTVIVEFDIDHPQLKDTTSFFYRYEGNRIVYQKRVFPNGDSTVYKLISNEQDVFTYQFISYHPSRQYEEQHIFTYLDNKLVKLKKSTESTTETISYAYYPNGHTKRRTVNRIPETADMSDLGGRGSDDIFYEYTYDENGRKKDYYVTINGQKSKAASYKYGY